MKRRCAMVFLLFAGGCAHVEPNVQQDADRGSENRTATVEAGVVRAAADAAVAKAGDVFAERLDAALANVEATIDSRVEARVGPISAALEETRTSVAADIKAARDAITKTTTNNGITGWQLVIGAVCYFAMSKGTDLVAIWRRLPGKDKA